MNMSDTPRNRYGLLDHLEWTWERHAAQLRKFAPIAEDVDLAIENMGRYIDRLEAKLEIADEHGYDGIDCRDETIKLLEANLKERNQQLATERARADKAEEALKRLVDLKDIKDKFGKNDWYLTEQPLAWEAARSAIDKAMK